MPFNWWEETLSYAQKMEIILKAEERYNGHNCYWCGSPITSGNYDYTSSAKDPKMICKGECKAHRFFDDPV